MTQKERKCLACGRPLTGRKRKWCGHPDCGGWLAVHPPTTAICVSCGEVYETYVDWGSDKCWKCENPGLVLRNPKDLSKSEIDELLVDYIRMDEAEAYIISCKKLKPKVEQSTETMTFKGGNGSPFSIDFTTTTIYNGHYNPNYCATCKNVTDHDQHGYCLTCCKKNPTALSVCYCDYCSDYTLNDASGICLRCNKQNIHYNSEVSVIEIMNKRTAQYEKWTGEKNWQYDAMTYWVVAGQKMYEMVIDGQSLPDIAKEFNIKENTMKSKVRAYCQEHGLDSPWKRKKK